MNCGLGAVIALLQGSAGSGGVSACGGTHDAHAAFHQLFIAGAYIYHQVAVNLARLIMVAVESIFSTFFALYRFSTVWNR